MDYNTSIIPFEVMDFFGDLGSLAGGFLFVALVVAMLVALIAIIYYVFNSLMLYKLAQKRGTENAWLAWIPLGNMYLLGKVGGPMMLFGKWKIEKPELILLLTPIALWLVDCVLKAFILVPFIGVLFEAIASVIGFIGSTAYLVFQLCVLYRIFTAYVPKNTALVYSLVSIINITIPFFFASILKKDAISESYDFKF